MAQTVKNLLAMRETLVQSLGWEDPLEEGMGTHSSILVWRIPMDRGGWWATVHGVAKNQTWLDMTGWLSTAQHKWNWVCQIIEVCWFLVSTAKSWGQPVLLQGILKQKTSGRMIPGTTRICPNNPCSGHASHEHKAPNWLGQIVTEFKLTPLVVQQANESPRWGVEARKRLKCWSQLTEKMVD